MRQLSITIVLLLFSVPIYTCAQSVDGLFSDFIKEFKGISLWSSVSTSKNVNNELQLRSGFSLKFGKITYEKLIKYDKLKLVKIDTIIDNGKKTTTKHYDIVSVSVIEPGVYTIDTIIDNGKKKVTKCFQIISDSLIEPKIYTSFHLGYETSKNRIIKGASYTVPSSITGYTINTVTSYKPYECLGLSLIFGGGLLSLSSPNSTITDNLSTTMPTEISATSLGAEIGVGLSYTVIPKKFYIFMDMTYQYIDFENPTIKRSIEETASNTNHYTYYPHSLDFSATYLKFGISISN